MSPSRCAVPSAGAATAAFAAADSAVAAAIVQHVTNLNTAGNVQAAAAVRRSLAKPS